MKAHTFSQTIVAALPSLQNINFSSILEKTNCWNVLSLKKKVIDCFDGKELLGNNLMMQNGGCLIQYFRYYMQMWCQKRIDNEDGYGHFERYKFMAPIGIYSIQKNMRLCSIYASNLESCDHLQFMHRIWIYLV